MQAHPWYVQKTFLPLLGCLFILLQHVNGFHTIPFMPTMIFFFALFNPPLLPLLTVVVLGIFADLIASNFFGLNTFIFVFIFFAANFFKRFLSDLSFWGIWTFFTLLNGLIFTFNAFIFLLSFNHFPILPFLQEWIASCFFFPIFMLMCNRCNTWLTGGDYDRLEV